MYRFSLPEAKKIICACIVIGRAIFMGMQQRQVVVCSNESWKGNCNVHGIWVVPPMHRGGCWSRMQSAEWLLFLGHNFANNMAYPGDGLMRETMQMNKNCHGGGDNGITAVQCDDSTMRVSYHAYINKYTSKHLLRKLQLIETTHQQYAMYTSRKVQFVQIKDFHDVLQETCLFQKWKLNVQSLLLCWLSWWWNVWTGYGGLGQSI